VYVMLLYVHVFFATCVLKAVACNVYRYHRPIQIPVIVSDEY
jgi:hypothetical protein